MVVVVVVVVAEEGAEVEDEYRDRDTGLVVV